MIIGKIGKGAIKKGTVRGDASTLEIFAMMGVFGCKIRTLAEDQMKAASIIEKRKDAMTGSHLVSIDKDR
jgi:hypothetical protein